MDSSTLPYAQYIASAIDRTKENQLKTKVEEDNPRGAIMTKRKEVIDGKLLQLDDTLVLSIPQTARLLGISSWQAYRLAKAGEIPTIKLGGCIKVSKVMLQRMLEAADAA